MSKILRIRLHYTWFFVFALVITIVTTQFSEDYSLWQRLVLGVAVALLFLLTAFIREFILSLAAYRKETTIKKISLFAFGGVYQENRARIVSTHMPLLYLARFLSNLVFAVIFYGLFATFMNAGDLMLAGIAQWLTYIYFLLFLVHFIPAFPLDGGDILRMLLWKSSGSYYNSTRIASLTGLITGLFFIFGGVLFFIVTQQWMISLLIVAIGWFIQIAAGHTRRRIKTLMVLQGIKAETILTREYAVISPQMNIGQLLREQILTKGWNEVMVGEGSKLKGILTLRQIEKVAGKRRNSTTAGDIMTPVEKLKTAQPQQTADTLLEEMDQEGTDIIAVLQEDYIMGVVTRNNLLNLVKIRTGFGA